MRMPVYLFSPMYVAVCLHRAHGQEIVLTVDGPEEGLATALAFTYGIKCTHCIAEFAQNSLKYPKSPFYAARVC